MRKPFPVRRAQIPSTATIVIALLLPWAACFRDPDVTNMKCTKECPRGFVCVNPDPSGPNGHCYPVGDGGTGVDAVGLAAGDGAVTSAFDASGLDAFGGSDVRETGAQDGISDGGGAARPDGARDIGAISGSDTGLDVTTDAPLLPPQDTGSGGVPGTGGSVGTGGTTGSGEASGDASADSAVATGGVVGTGGLTVTGGVIGTGGMATAGGAGTAGVTGSGGITGTGGTTSTGGNTGTGGTPGTGGGTASPLGASGYPPAGTSGQAQPTGSGTTVTVLDWGNFKTAVSFTFDDANQSQLDNYTALQAENDQGNNVRYTFYLITGKSQASKYGQAQKDGHELANHTKSHSSDATTTDIQAAQDFLKSTYGITSYDIAAPNGASSYSTVVPSMKEFLTNRSPNNSGGMSPTDAPSSRQWSLPCIIPGTGDPASTMESSISAAISGGKWITFLVHGFNTPASDQSEGAYQPVSITEFTSTVSWAKAQGTIWIDTVENVSAYWIAEYNFKKLTPTASGTDKTWTWKTSDFNAPFPPGKYLRVTTDGGTLKQGSTVLTWDDHGYYEVSLDAGTLTLSP